MASKSTAMLVLCPVFFWGQPTPLIADPPSGPMTQALSMDAEPVWGATTQDCRIGLSVDHIRVRAGDPIDITITVENMGKSAVLCGTRDEPFSGLGVDGLVETGGAVKRTEYGTDLLQGKPRLNISNYIKPGAKMVRKMRVNRILDLTIASSYAVKVTARIGTKTGDILSLASKSIAVTVIDE